MCNPYVDTLHCCFFSISPLHSIFYLATWKTLYIGRGFVHKTLAGSFDPVREWHLKCHACIWWMAIFHKVDASKWQVLNLGKELFSLNLPQKVESLHNWWLVLDTLLFLYFMITLEEIMKAYKILKLNSNLLALMTLHENYLTFERKSLLYC